ncbi:MAG: hypothetical protein Q7R70_01240 [Candidatus Diapherotrites archaeon]|nr:hypothetical protein [Candidatus Diapherotrites archaeon]
MHRPFRKTPLKKRVLKYTIKVQKEWPDKTAHLPGRLALSERAGYFRGLTGMLVKDEVLAYLLLDYHNSPEKIVQDIQKHVANVTKGNIPRAIHYIDDTIRRVRDASVQNPTSLVLQRMARIKGLSEKDSEKYAQQIGHLINYQTSEIISTLEICKMRLQRK